MSDLWKNFNYLIIVIILFVAVYFVIIDTNRQITAKEEVDLKDRVAQNAKYPKLVAGVIPNNSPYRGQRICPAGSAQLASSDHDCNFCHKIADGIIKFSDATHEYSFIAGAKAGIQANNKAGAAFPEPSTPGYTVEPFPDPAPTGTNPADLKTSPLLSPAKIKNIGQRAKDSGTILPGTAPPIKWGKKLPHPKRGICTDCHEVI
jgi:hypothetical protein